MSKKYRVLGTRYWGLGAGILIIQVSGSHNQVERLMQAASVLKLC
jgi:hypothetical protein